MTNDPKDIIEYINNLKEKENIDYLRIEFNEKFPSDNIELLKAYYQTNGKIKMKLNRSKSYMESKSVDSKKYNEYSYMFDKNLSPYDILARYINEQENSVIITGDQIKELLQDS